ncbi:protein FAM216B-like isoform X2 [Heterodontus francisci]|uniref:protein FAM216B-like isoform X2 n=1 Tax=Heterodontus francisci TaxID=7792 RepID=UPI00355C6CE4
MGEKTRLLSNQHWPPGMMRRVKVPRSMLEGSLLKDLNIGQQRYMYSIFTIYKAGPLRRSLHQQYINSLERQRMLGYMTTEEMNKFVDYLRSPRQQQYQKWSPLMVRATTASPRKQDHHSQPKPERRWRTKR